MAVGRISGPLLKANLLRNGVDLAFETDLLYLDVVNGRIGIHTTAPSHDLQVVGTTRTTNLEVTTQADIATFTINSNTIASSSGTINLEPNGTNPVVYQGKIVTGDLQLSTNVIETTATDQDLEIRTLGTGEVKIYSDVYVDGNLHATGTITADGDITIGNEDTDNIVFNADINSNVIPNLNTTYDLGSDPTTGGKEWKNGYIKNIFSTSLTADSAVVNGIVLEQPQGNTIYVAANGDDANAGVHQNNPLATIKAALTQAVSGDTIFVYPGTYEEIFPLTVPAGVTVKGSGIRAVKIVPTTETRYNDAVLLNGDTTVEDLTVADFFSNGNFFEILSASSGTASVNVGTAPFAHTYVSGGTVTFTGNLTYPAAPSTIYTTTASSVGSLTINVGTVGFAHTYVSGGTVTFNENTYNVTNAVYTHTTGVLVITHEGSDAGTSTNVTLENLVFSCVDATANITGATYTHTTGNLVITHDGGNIASTSAKAFLSSLTFSCNGSTRVFPDNGYAFRFADNFTVTSRSPYVRNCTVITKGSVTSAGDPLGFDQGDAGKGAYIDGAYANALSKEASMLFHSVTFITPGVDCITAKNGVRIEWLNSFTYFANKGIYAFASNYGFAQQGKTRLRIDNRAGTWATGNTLSYYDTDGTTLLASGVIDSIDGNYVNLTGRCLGFQTITDRVGKTVYANGAAKLSTSQFKFGSASLLLDGTSDYASLASQLDFAFETDDFTIETWVYPTAAGTYRTLFDFRSSAGDTGGIILGLSDTGALYFFYNGNYRIGPVGTVSINSWTHVALCRSSGVTRAFVNGTQVGSDYADANTYAMRGVRIGADPNGNFAFTGNFDDVRITKGTAKYTSNFVAPTAALTGDLSTVLLLHFNGANNSTTFLDDGITFQDLRTSALGTATLINFADYSDFGAEIRSIGSACIYGNYGTYGDGQGVIAYLISQNFAYVGAGKLSTNDPNDRIAANEVTELNGAHIYRTSVDNEGNFSVGDSFYVNQKTGDVLFNGTATNITSATGVTFSDGVHTTTITPTDVTTGNIRISGNTVESLTGDVNVVSANGNINLQNNTNITGDLDVTGDITIGGNITIGNQSTDTIEFVGRISSDIIPAINDQYNLGASTPTELRWKNAYLNRVEIDGVVIDNNLIATTVGDDDLILQANGTGRIYIPTSDVQIDQNLTVNGLVSSDSLEVTTTITADKFAVTDIEITDNYITTTVTNSDLELLANGTGRIYVPSNNVQIDQDLTVDGLTTLGNTNIGTALAPKTLTHIGTLTHTGNVTQTGDYELTGNLTVQGTTAQFKDIKLLDNLLTTTVTNSDLQLVANGTGRVYIPSNDVLIDQSLTVTTDLTVTTGTTYLKNTSVTGTITQTGDINQTGNFTTSGNTQVTGNITGTGYLQLSNIRLEGNTVSTTVTNSDLQLVANGTGNVIFEGFKFQDNNIQSVVTNSDLIFTPQGTGRVVVNSNQSLVIPVGTTGDRPLTPANGMIRFNTTIGRYEGYNNGHWLALSGVQDEDGNTYIKAEAYPGANDNTLYFYADGSLMATIDSTKLFATRLQTSSLDIQNNTITTLATDTDINLTTLGTGGVKIGNLRIHNNTITNVSPGAVTEFVETGSGYIKVAGTNGFVIPSGLTTDRPGNLETGMTRFNTDLQLVEVWNGSIWTGVAGTSSGITVSEAEDLGVLAALLLG